MNAVEARAFAVLKVVSRLAPSGRSTDATDTIPLEVTVDRDVGDALARLQQLRGGFYLRVGWLFVAGRHEVGGVCDRKRGTLVVRGHPGSERQ